MKPFSIKEHLEHPDWKVVTREGEPVRILCADLADDDYPVAAATKNRHVDRYTAEGRFQAGNETKYDLFFATKKREGWINICSNLTEKDAYCGKMIHPTKADAKCFANNAIATIKIEWEE